MVLSYWSLTVLTSNDSLNFTLVLSQIRDWKNQIFFFFFVIKRNLVSYCLNAKLLSIVKFIWLKLISISIVLSGFNSRNQTLLESSTTSFGILHFRSKTNAIQFMCHHAELMMNIGIRNSFSFEYAQFHFQ